MTQRQGHFVKTATDKAEGLTEMAQYSELSPATRQSSLATLPFLMFRFLIALILLGASVPAHATSSRPCHARGEASHYGVGDGYHGRTAADGSRFDAYGLTAAHPWLPFGSKLRVTNLSNGRSVTVRVTDRGPFVGGRIVDLSYGSFSRIASPGQGVARVCISRL